MDQELRNYETIFILDPLLDDEKVNRITDKYAGLITKNGCTLLKTDKWGRKKFAYPIKKKLTGYYVSLEFEGKPGIITKLEKSIHLDDNILRYLTISFATKARRERELYFEKKQTDALDKEREIAAEEAASRKPAEKVNTGIPSTREQRA